MNVLFVTNARPLDHTTAGGDLYLENLIQGLLRIRVSPYLTFPDLEKPGHLHLRKYDSFGGYADSSFDSSNIEANFVEVLESFGGDIVHFQHFQTLPLSLMQKAKALGKKLIITIHDYFLWCKNFFLLSPLKGSRPSFCSFEQNETVCAECLKKSTDVRQLIYGRAWSDEYDSEEYVRQRRSTISHLLGTADAIIAPTGFVRDSFLNGYFTVDPDRFVVIEHGMSKELNTLERNGDGNSGKLKVAFLGGFKYEKGSVYFSDLIKSMGDRDVDFYIIGNMSTPIAADVSSSVTITGQYRREELSGILAQEGIDLILLLSPCAETFSFTLSEAISNTIPVVATDTGAFRERIAKYGVGFLVPYEDPVPRASRIIRDIADNRKILEFFTRNSKDAARCLKDVDTMVSEYADVYRKMIA